MYKLEVETFHASHAELGAYVMSLWGLQEPVVEAIAFHPMPSVVQHEAPVALTCVHLANVFDYEQNPVHIIGVPPALDGDMLQSIKLHKSLEKLRHIVK